MNILITGIHGFVGSNLVAALKNDHSIYGLDIISPPKDGVIHTFSWSELDRLPEVDVILHLAGKAHDTKNKSNAQVYFDVNTGLTETIYNWYLSSKATKFIFFSSVKAAADKVIGEILTEEVTPLPIGPYGESKIEAEKYILSQVPSITNHLKKTYILRPCMIHGPGNKGNLNLLYSLINKGVPWPLGSFENQRSYTSINNLTFIINKLIDQTIASGIYNIADDEFLSTNQIISIISNELNQPVRILKINKSLIRFFAMIGTWFHLPLDKDKLKKLTENYKVSNYKIKKSLSISELPITATEGIVHTIRNFNK